MDSDIMRRYKENCERALAKIKDVDAFRKTDEMVDYVFKVGGWLFENNIDTLADPALLKAGGRISGAYSFLSHKAAEAKARAVVFEEEYDKMVNQLAIEGYERTEKITHAKTEAKVLCEGIRNDVIEAAAVAEQFKGLIFAADKMTSFIQTALAMRRSEHFRGQLNDNN
jgi:hypothetical protein